MEVGVTPFILSGTVLIFICGNFDVQIIMRKSALKMSMIPQKSEWLASLS